MISDDSWTNFESFEDAVDLIKEYREDELGLLQKIVDRKRDRALTRFWIGEVIHKLQSDAEYGDGIMDRITDLVGASKSYLRESRQFYEAHEGSRQACEAWMDHVEQERGQVNWGYCRNWARKQLSGDDYDEDQDKVEQEITRLERRAQRLDQDAQELEEQVHEANVDEDAKAEALGVAARARQVAEETRHKAETMELEDYERVEDEEYREWIRSQPCIVRDRTGDDVDPHHAIEGGQGSKASDYTCLPLCHDLHEELHGPNMSREKFEDKYEIDIWQEIADHITRFFTGRPINR
jgi:ribosomal protein L9